MFVARVLLCWLNPPLLGDVWLKQRFARIQLYGVHGMRRFIWFDLKAGGRSAKLKTMLRAKLHPQDANLP